MELKGMEKLREKLPKYPGKRIALLPLRGLLWGTFAYLFLIVLDVIPRLLPDFEILITLEPFIPIAGSCLIAFIALRLIASLWTNRDRMKAEYGNLAYQKMITRGVTGVILVPTLVFHAFTSIRSLPPGPPVNDLTTAWSQSLLPLLGVATEIDVILRIGVSGILLILGILTARSAIVTFGLDYMVVMYLYFPEASEIQEHEIYSVMRHPAYFAGVLLGAAGLAFRFSIYSMILFIIVYAVFRLHIRREERELVERFGESYASYMKTVPGLRVRLKDLPAFFRFLRFKS